MQQWIVFAIVSMFFAGFTSVIAKLGLDGISAELGLAIRTCFVFAFVLLFSSATIPRAQVAQLTRANLLWLGISGVTTALSWIFYYRAIKHGEVSTVALIDKGSFVVSVLMAWMILGERITPRLAVGAGLIVLGLLVVSRR